MAPRNPLRRFLDTEIAGGVVLLVAALVALAWANSPWRGGYRTFWETELVIRLGDHVLRESLRGWVNEGLMALFFFVAGLEIKREIVEGELRELRKAALPVVTAIGGMLGAGAVYLAVNRHGDAAHGWGVPMATDIAFAVGVLALLGSRASPAVKLLLLTLAIVDDIGSIIVIAVFYSDAIAWGALAVAAGFVVAVVLLRAAHVHWTVAYLVAGCGMWLALKNAGVSPTLAGVAMGLLAPSEPVLRPDNVEGFFEQLADVSSPSAARTTVLLARGSVSVVERLEYLLHPWSSYGVVPLFALANAGIFLGGGAIGDAWGSRVAAGVVAARLLGKFVGVTGAAWLACRLRIAVLPDGIGPREVAAVGALAGIGFSVSFLLADLSFTDAALVDQAKLAVLASAVVASVVGGALLWFRTGRAAPAAGGGRSTPGGP